MTAALVLAARVVLAAVLALAGVTKLVDRPGTRSALAGFGAPSWAARPGAVALPVAELAAAALLLPARTAPAGAALSVSLLAVFSVAIGYNLARGRAPECHCFGQLHSAPAGRRTLARTAALFALALLALVGSIAEPEGSAVGWIGRVQPAELLALATAVSAAAVLVAGALGFVSLLRSYGRILVRLDRIERALGEVGIDVSETAEQPELGLPPGTPSPVFPELDELLEPGLPVLLVFTSTTCGPCKTLVPEISRWQEQHADALTIAVASDGPAVHVAAEAEEFALRNVLVDTDARLYQAFEASGTPSAVVIAPDGSVGSWVAPGRDWIVALLARTLESGAERPGLEAGIEMPAFALPSLTGQEVTRTDLEGRDTALLFWNPHCGFCQTMHPEVLALERSAGGNTPHLVVISLGDEESIQENGFASTVLLDGSFTVGEALGVTGTPSAVLVTADGRVASGLAVGTDDVLALLRNGHG